MCRTEILPPFKRVVQVRQLRILRCPRQNWLALGEGIPTAQSVSMPGLTEVCEVRVAAQKGPVLYTRGFPGDTGKSFDLAGREIAPPKFVFVADLPEMIAPLFNLADAKPGVATGREVLHGELLISSECKIRAFLLSREKQVYEPVTLPWFSRRPLHGICLQNAHLRNKDTPQNHGLWSFATTVAGAFHS